MKRTTNRSMAGNGEESSVKHEIYKPHYRSKVWKHFGFLKKGDVIDKSVAICEVCNVEIKYSGNTTNLSTHLQRRHGIGNNSETANATYNDPTTSSSSSPAVSIPAATSSVTIPQDMNSATDKNLPGMCGWIMDHDSPQAQNITASIAKFICKDMQPYSVVENPAFREMIQTLEPRYQIPSCLHFSEQCIPEFYNKVKNDVKLFLSQAERVAITVDCWHSCSNQEYITIMSHHIDPEWNMKRFVLQTRLLNKSYTGKNFGVLLNEACTEWRIFDKNPAIVTNNDEEKIVENADAQFSPHIICFAHMLNQTALTGLAVDGAAKVLEKVRRIIGYFHCNPTASHILNEKLLSQDRLRQDIITRWNSSYDMLECFLEQKAAILATLMSKDLRKRSMDINMLSENDIIDVEDIVKLMAPFKMATTAMCEEDQPTVSVIAPLQVKLLKHLQPCQSDSSLISEIKTVMAHDLSKCYRGTQDALNIASALDPRFKELPYLEKEDRECVYAKLTLEASVSQQTSGKIRHEEEKGSTGNFTESQDDTAELVDIKPDPEMWQIQTWSMDQWPTMTPPAQEPPAKKKALDALFGDSFSQKGRKSTNEMAREEVIRYQAKDALPLTENVMGWWRSHQKELPLLSTLAKRYLCIPGTTVSAERVFNTAGDVVQAQRSIVRPDHLDQLIFLKENL